MNIKIAGLAYAGPAIRLAVKYDFSKIDYFLFLRERTAPEAIAIETIAVITVMSAV